MNAIPEQKKKVKYLKKITIKISKIKNIKKSYVDPFLKDLRSSFPIVRLELHSQSPSLT